MSPTLFDFNHHVLPGDVLLLRSKGIRAAVNLAAQQALRPLHSARFTHVAFVISNTHIADAMPKVGVRVRRWRDACDAYDLEQCVVARHPDLLSLARSPAPLLERVQHYYAQRYGLKALGRKTVKHDAGVVCSQFVAMVLHDLGQPAFGRAAMRVLPSDIDHGTRTRGQHGWRQFPFTAYGFNSDLSLPPLGDLYWAVLEAHVERRPLKPEALAQNGEATKTGAAVLSDHQVLDLASSPPRTWAELAAAFSDAVGEQMAESMRVNELIGRSIAVFDRLVLTVTSSTDAQGQQALPLANALLNALGAGEPNESLKGQIFLDLWHALFVDMPIAIPTVLANVDAQQRLELHRTRLGEAIEELTRLAADRNQAAEDFQTQWDLLPNLARQGGVPVELIKVMHDQALLLLSLPDWLDSDATDTILDRTDRYAPLVVEVLTPWAAKVSKDVATQALNQISSLMKLDEQRLQWVISSKPRLQLFADALADLLSSGPDAHPPR